MEELEKPKKFPGSFRDPSGYVYEMGGQIFRTITSQGIDNFNQVQSTGFLSRLVELGLLVPFEEVKKTGFENTAENPVKVLRHPKLNFISYPYEWSFSGLKAAALLQLKIQLLGIDKNIVTTDATAYNIQFEGHKPVFIDHLSFRPYRDGEYWLGHRQFCEHFLAPLLLQSYLGIPFHAWYRGGLEGISYKDIAKVLPLKSMLSLTVFTNVILPSWFENNTGKKSNSSVSNKIQNKKLPKSAYKSMVHGLYDYVSKLKPYHEHKTVWQDYEVNNIYNDEETTAKIKYITDFIKETKPAVVWDIGCNTGKYSEVAINAGAKQVIGFEYDMGALELSCQRAENKNLNFLPLYMDIANPTPSQGWNQKERLGIFERRNADVIIALAVIHHLAIGRNIPLQEIIEWLVQLAPSGVIEFVPKSDPMVQELLKLREDVFENYNYENFEKYLLNKTEIIKSRDVTRTGRKLIWYNRTR